MKKQRVWALVIGNSCGKPMLLVKSHGESYSLPAYPHQSGEMPHLSAMRGVEQSSDTETEFTIRHGYGYMFSRTRRERLPDSWYRERRSDDVTGRFIKEYGPSFGNIEIHETDEESEKHEGRVVMLVAKDTEKPRLGYHFIPLDHTPDFLFQPESRIIIEALREMYKTSGQGEIVRREELKAQA